MVRCTNSGITCIIDRFGVIREQLKDAQQRSVATEGILVTDWRWRPAQQPTLYARTGDWIVLLSVLVIASVILQRLWERFRKPTH